MSKPKFTTEWESKTYDKANEAMSNLLNLANSMGSGTSVVAGMLNGFIKEHRTLQQAGIRNFVQMLRLWTENEKSVMIDMRNAAAWDFAKEVAKLDLSFPNI